MKKILLYLFPVVAIAVIGGVIYSNALTGSFQFDDHFYILDNPAVRDVQNVPQLWERLDYRKRLIPFLSFAINYQIDGDNVFGYHLVNLVIHLLNAVMVRWLVLLTFSTPALAGDGMSRHKGRLALLTALLFLSHPIQTQAVTYISQRFTSLATLFYLASLCLYILGRQSNPGPDFNKGRVRVIGCFLGSATFALLGMFSKEIVFTLPVMIALYEFYFLKDTAKAGHAQRQFLAWTGLSLTVLLLLFFIKAPQLLEASNTHTPRGVYFLTQLRVIMTYIRLLFFPAGQNLKYDYPLSQGLFELPTLFSLAAILALLYIAIKIRPKQPLISFGILWFFLTLSVESSFIPIRDVINEHRLYLPSVGFCLLFIAGIYHLIKDHKKFTIVISMIVLAFSFLTYQRNKIWQEGKTLWQDVVTKSPQDVTGHINIASEYYAKGEWALAFMHLDKALDIYAKTKARQVDMMRSNLGQQQFEASMENYREFLHLSRQEEALYIIQGNLAQKIGKDELAEDAFRKAQEVQRMSNSYIYYRTACNYIKNGNIPKAREYLLKAKTLNPLTDDWFFKYTEDSLSAGRLIGYDFQ